MSSSDLYSFRPARTLVSSIKELLLRDSLTNPNDFIAATDDMNRRLCPVMHLFIGPIDTSAMKQ